MYIYNTLTKKNKELIPIKKSHCKLYLCGITPYSECHIGHMRTFIVFDALVRYLRYKKYKITYIQNITDVDDKIINEALKKKKKWKTLTNYYINKLQKERKSLHILPPTKNPTVTKNINNIIKIIIILFEKKYAYRDIDEDIKYSLKKNKTYGLLSKRQKKHLISAENDFVLWKKKKKNEPFWKSPFGNGRPGWHIECTAIAKKFLGNSFDIHGGGIDLVFPHHENEIAQFFGITKKIKINIWMHIGLVQENNKKISKTEKNYIPLEKLLKRFNKDCIRYYLLNKSYRKPLEFLTSTLDKYSIVIDKFNKILKPLEKHTNITIEKETSYEKYFLNALENNLDTVTAISILHKLEKKISQDTDYRNTLKLRKLFKYLANIIGLMLPTQKKNNIHKKREEIIKYLIEKRNEQRKKKNWSIADKIRDNLKKIYNVEIIDKKENEESNYNVK